MKRTPVKKRRTGKPRRGPARDLLYLDFVRDHPCLVCSDQKTPTEAAHVGARGLIQKCSDYQTVPLCAEHHRTGKDAHHRLGRNFFKHWGLDVSNVTLELRARYLVEYPGRTIQDDGSTADV